MRRVLSLAAIALAFGWFARGAAQSKKKKENPCTDQLERQASDSIDRLQKWPAVYQSFKRFPACDDGEIAEGYSDAVAQLLAKHWNALPELIRLTSSDLAFKDFVIRHIDATASYGDLKAADRNARLHCPSNARGLCTAIRREAEAAIKEGKQDTD